MTKSERLKVRLKTVHIAWQVSGDTRHSGWPVPHPPPDNGFRGYTLASVILIRRLKMSDTCSWKARFCAARTVQVRRIRSLVAPRRVGYNVTQSGSQIVCSVGHAMPFDFEDRKSKTCRLIRARGIDARSVLYWFLSELRPQSPISNKLQINFIFDDNKIILNISNGITRTTR